MMWPKTFNCVRRYVCVIGTYGLKAKVIIIQRNKQTNKQCIYLRHPKASGYLIRHQFPNFESSRDANTKHSSSETSRSPARYRGFDGVPRGISIISENNIHEDSTSQLHSLCVYAINTTKKDAFVISPSRIFKLLCNEEKIEQNCFNLFTLWATF